MASRCAPERIKDRIEASLSQAVIVQKILLPCALVIEAKLPGARFAWLLLLIAYHKKAGRKRIDRSRKRVIEMSVIVLLLNLLRKFNKSGWLRLQIREATQNEAKTLIDLNLSKPDRNLHFHIRQSCNSATIFGIEPYFHLNYSCIDRGCWICA